MMKRFLSALLVLILLFASALAEDGWTPRQAPAVRNAISEEEKTAAIQAILDKGEFLFKGALGQRYTCMNLKWLKESAPTDVLALLWACDDVTHGGWGVLGVESSGKQLEIKAASDQPDKVRLRIIPIQELMDLTGAATPADLRGLSIGAWNGGRIAGLYYLAGDVAQELLTYQAQVEEAEQIIHTYTGELSNPNAIENAKKLYEYLKEINGQVCLTGQMESTWMGSPDYEVNFIEKHTGKLPALRGLDFMHNDFNGVTNRAIAWWKKGGIPSICWHTGSDFASGYNESKDHNLNWDEALTPGTADYNKLLKAMDRAVPYLQKLEDAGVPVLWRPFHELDGGWFWWSKGGSDSFVKLWQLMYSRYTDYWGLDNLIWVLGYSGNGGDMASWYPGDSYVDVLGADSYTPGANGHLYAECLTVAPEGMPIVFHECGSIPTQEQMQQAAAPWALFMVWHTDYLTDGKSNTKDSLKAIYNSDYFITLDELPAF